MSIRHVCVDRGRIIRKEATAARVEGTTTYVGVPEQWFRCRLFLEGTTDAMDAQGARWESVSSPQVLAVRRDEDGNWLDFRGDERIEIKSYQFGRHVWRMNGEPQPLRKRRRVIGWLLVVSRVVEREADDLLHQRVPDVFVPGVGSED